MVGFKLASLTLHFAPAITTTHADFCLRTYICRACASQWSHQNRDRFLQIYRQGNHYLLWISQHYARLEKRGELVPSINHSYTHQLVFIDYPISQAEDFEEDPPTNSDFNSVTELHAAMRGMKMPKDSFFRTKQVAPLTGTPLHHSFLILLLNRICTYWSSSSSSSSSLPLLYNSTATQEFGWNQPKEYSRPEFYRHGSDLTKFAAELIKNGVYW